MEQQAQSPVQPPRSLKCVFVGDALVGKTCLVVPSSLNAEYVPTVMDNYTKTVTAENQQIILELWDLGGSPEYEKLRASCYANVDVFVLCFSVVSPSSFSTLVSRWHPELHERYPNTPILLVGLKTDLRDNKDTINKLKEKNQVPITTKQGKSKVKELTGCVKYVECSSLTQQHIKDVFEDIVQVALKKSDACVIM
mmetsp:Transcript_5418/g.7611  ORF Transcript_5418/g.7611 Transcript_5418/m.7611 type:complete len:196 (-) Transcript_5418:36-623(-)